MKRKMLCKKLQLGAATILSAMLLSSCGASNSAVKDALDEASWAVQEAVDEANEAVDEAVNDVYKDSLNAFKEEGYETVKETSAGEEQSAVSKSIGTVAEYDNNESYATGGEQNEIPNNAVEASPGLSTANEKKIRTVRMTLECKNLENASQGLKERVKAQGGYIESEDYTASTQYDSSKTMFFTLRIPKENVDSFLDFLNGEGRVLSKSENLEDVRLQYWDTKSHIKALETEQERILALMEKAETIDQLIALESRLTDIRYQLESYNTEILDYDNRINFSTIYLELQESIDGKLNNTKAYTFSDKVRDGFYRNLFGIQRFFSGIAVFTLVYIPQLFAVLLVILALVLLNKKLNAKAKKRKEQEQNALKPEDSVKADSSVKTEKPIETEESTKTEESVKQ